MPRSVLAFKYPQITTCAICLSPLRRENGGNHPQDQSGTCYGVSRVASRPSHRNWSESGGVRAPKCRALGHQPDSPVEDNEYIGPKDEEAKERPFDS